MVRKVKTSQTNTIICFKYKALTTSILVIQIYQNWIKGKPKWNRKSSLSNLVFPFIINCPSVIFRCHMRRTRFRRVTQETITFSYVVNYNFCPHISKYYEPSKIFDNYFFVIIGRVYVIEEFAFPTPVLCHHCNILKEKKCDFTLICSLPSEMAQ